MEREAEQARGGEGKRWRAREGGEERRGERERERERRGEERRGEEEEERESGGGSEGSVGDRGGGRGRGGRQVERRTGRSGSRNAPTESRDGPGETRLDGQRTWAYSVGRSWRARVGGPTTTARPPSGRASAVEGEERGEKKKKEKRKRKKKKKKGTVLRCEVALEALGERSRPAGLFRWGLLCTGWSGLRTSWCLGAPAVRYSEDTSQRTLRTRVCKQRPASRAGGDELTATHGEEEPQCRAADDVVQVPQVRRGAIVQVDRVQLGPPLVDGEGKGVDARQG